MYTNQLPRLQVVQLLTAKVLLQCSRYLRLSQATKDKAAKVKPKRTGLRAPIAGSPLRAAEKQGPRHLSL